MATTLKPRNGLVLIQIMEEKEAKTVSGIIIPKDKTTQFRIATVLEVGPGTWDAGKQCATEDLRAGMRVLVRAAVLAGVNQLGGASMGDIFPSFDTSQGKVGLMNQMDIVAIVEGTPEPVAETPKLAFAE